MYDTAFRYMAASHVAMSWGKVNEQLYNDILKEETLSYCVHCHTYGHRTLGCPTRSKPVQPFRPFSSSTTTPSPTPLAQPPTIPSHPATSTPSKQPSVTTSTAGPAAAPTVTSSISATNQTAVETTLALSAQKYPNCNSIHPIFSPPLLHLSKLPTSQLNSSTIPTHSLLQAFYTTSNGAVMLAIPALALLA